MKGFDVNKIDKMEKKVQMIKLSASTVGIVVLLPIEPKCSRTMKRRTTK